MSDNRHRILAEVLTIDAWHDPFQIDGRKSGVFIEASFREGRLGGGDEALPFTFRITLKKALLTVSAENPLKVRRASVARDIPQSSSEMTRILQAKEAVANNAAAKGELSLKSLATSLTASVGTSTETSRADEMKIVQQVPRILVTGRPGGANEYSWDLQPSYEPFLEGQPWDPVARPRLEVIHPQARSKIEPVIKVSLTCAIEDVSITDLTPKPASLIESIKRTFTGEINYAAAVQHLKRVLLKADLEVADVDDRFGRLWIADVLSQEEPEDRG